MLFQPIYKNTEQINSDAESFLKTHHPSLSIPIPIEAIIDLQLGIFIIPIPGLKDDFAKTGRDIDAFISSDFKDLSVDKYIYDCVNTRYRFTLAHEIGHMFLHGYLYSQFKFKTIDEWNRFISELPLRERREIEWQADEFAGLVLVPRKILKDEFRKAIKEAEEKLGMPLQENPAFVKDVAVEYYLTASFNVSREVIRIRLERDKIVARA